MYYTGLDDVTEIQSFKPNAPVRYICRMCNTKGSDTTMMNHIIGLPHKMAFFVSIMAFLVILSLCVHVLYRFG